MSLRISENPRTQLSVACFVADSEAPELWPSQNTTAEVSKIGNRIGNDYYLYRLPKVRPKSCMVLAGGFNLFQHVSTTLWMSNPNGLTRFCPTSPIVDDDFPIKIATLQFLYKPIAIKVTGRARSIAQPSWRKDVQQPQEGDSKDKRLSWTVLDLAQIAMWCLLKWWFFWDFDGFWASKFWDPLNGCLYKTF